MVVVAGAVEEEERCPVIHKWLQREDVLPRAAAKGKVALVRTKSITRETVADNHELLEPAVIHLGSSPTLNMHDVSKFLGVNDAALVGLCLRHAAEPWPCWGDSHAYVVPAASLCRKVSWPKCFTTS